MLKRLVDFFVAACGLIVAAPLLLALGILVWAKLGRPVLFAQTRPGMHGRPFLMFKFRTMQDAFDSAGRPLSDEQRLTRFGRGLRSASLDELPELWNVLKGDMSLVGPRPLLMRYVDRYTPKQARRHEVRPGITGWAQVNGRNAISWEQKFKLDVWYVENRSFWLDLRILALTVLKVLRREGVLATENATMPEFMGHQPAVQDHSDRIEPP